MTKHELHASTSLKLVRKHFRKTWPKKTNSIANMHQWVVLASSSSNVQNSPKHSRWKQGKNNVYQGEKLHVQYEEISGGNSLCKDLDVCKGCCYWKFLISITKISGVFKGFYQRKFLHCIQWVLRSWGYFTEDYSWFHFTKQAIKKEFFAH